MFNLDQALAERMSELEEQVRALSAENSLLRDREARAVRVLDQENERALKLRDDASSNGSGSNNNLRAQGRHDGYAAGVRFAAGLLRGNPRD